MKKRNQKLSFFVCIIESIVHQYFQHIESCFIKNRYTISRFTKFKNRSNKKFLPVHQEPMHVLSEGYKKEAIVNLYSGEMHLLDN